MKPVLKLLFELGPLAVFFIAYNRLDIFAATAAFMVAMVLSLIGSRLVLGRLPVMPLVTAVIVLVMGGLTLWLQDATFIKMKPTIVNVLFGGTLLIGLYFRKLFLRIVFDDTLALQEQGWRILTFRWGFFFLFLALLNEIVWRNFAEETWVSFKVFGVMPLTFAFAMAQYGVISKWLIEPDPDQPGEKSSTET